VWCTRPPAPTPEITPSRNCRSGLTKSPSLSPDARNGATAAYFSDYRTQRRPSENLNFGRAYWGNPTTSTSATAAQTRVTSGPLAGNTASGFGFMNTITPGFTGALVPRNGTLVARFQF